jgi:glycerol-3-phosphate dehydrogenase (NAD(P)+)
MAKISVLGAGAFGISLAVMTTNSGHDVTLWSAVDAEIDGIIKYGENKEKLAGIKVPSSIKLTKNIADVKGSDLVIFSIPTAFIRSVATEVTPHITENTIVVNTGKGLEKGTLKRLSQVLMEELGATVPIVVLSGPSHAEEVSVGVPTAVVVSSLNTKAAYYAQDTLCSEVFRIYVNDDVIGCELGGALKNVIALAAGICDGLGYGDNTKAALITRGVSEIAELGIKMGAKVDTFSGLTGLGDLIVTCMSAHSRNRHAGVLIGCGMSPEEAVAKVGTVEGYGACLAAMELGKKEKLSMPITSELYSVLWEKADPRASITKLMTRSNKYEIIGEMYKC